MTDYLGTPVLERHPNAREEPDDTSPRRLLVFDPGLGARSVVAQDQAPAIARTFLWTAQGRSEIVALKTWLGERQGRRVPFWVSTLRRELPLARAGASTDTSLTVEAFGYTRFAFPQPARRHLALHLPDGSTLYRQVQGAMESGDTEMLTLSAALGVAVPASTLVSYLVLCRLGSDEVDLEYQTDSIAEARIPFVELPEEAP